MNNQEIVFTKPGTAELLNTDRPRPGNQDVLVQTMVSTVSSGTEKALLTGEVRVSCVGHETKAHFPRQSGYSAAGIVAKIGKDVRSVKVGDRVAVSWSTHSAYCVVSESNVHKIVDDRISFSEAALWHISTFPLAAIRKCRLEIGESALVMGLGAVGILAVCLLKAAGAVPIIAVDPVKERREKAKAVGADFVFDPFSETFPEDVHAVSGGVNVALEATGTGRGLNGALDCMKRFGRVALLGCTRHSDFSVDYYQKVHGPGVTLIGAHTLARPEKESSSTLWTTQDDITAVQRLVQYGRLHLEKLVDEMHTPGQAPILYHRLAAEKSFPLVQFDWGRL